MINLEQKTSRRRIDTLIDDEIVSQIVVKYKITFFDFKEKIIESHLPLTQLYLKYESAATIEELD